MKDVVIPEQRQDFRLKDGRFFRAGRDVTVPQDVAEILFEAGVADRPVEKPVKTGKKTGKKASKESGENASQETGENASQDEPQESGEEGAAASEGEDASK